MFEEDFYEKSDSGKVNTNTLITNYEFGLYYFDYVIHIIY